MSANPTRGPQSSNEPTSGGGGSSNQRDHQNTNYAPEIVLQTKPNAFKAGGRQLQRTPPQNREFAHERKLKDKQQ